MGFTLFCCGLRGCRVRDNYSGNFHRGGGVAGGRLGACGVVRVINKNLDAENTSIVFSHGTNHTIGIGVDHCCIVTLRVVPKVIKVLFIENAVFFCSIFAYFPIRFITQNRSSAGVVWACVGTPLTINRSIIDIVLQKLSYANIGSIL